MDFDFCKLQRIFFLSDTWIDFTSERPPILDLKERNCLRKSNTTSLDVSCGHRTTRKQLKTTKINIKRIHVLLSSGSQYMARHGLTRCFLHGWRTSLASRKPLPASSLVS